jgi:hypothetical protein
MMPIALRPRYHISNVGIRYLSHVINRYQLNCPTAKNIALPLICPESFPLPQHMVRILRQASAEVHHGRGFVVIRGLHREMRSNEDTVILFCGLGSYIGVVRATGPNGMSMGEHNNLYDLLRIPQRITMCPADHLRDASRDPVPSGLKKAELHPSKMMTSLVSIYFRDMSLSLANHTGGSLLEISCR